MKALAIISWIVGFLPLAVYPFFFFGDTIAFSLMPGTPLDVLGMIVSASLWTTFLYPFVYFVLLIASILAAIRGSWKWSGRLAGACLIYLVLIIVLFGLWFVLSVEENRIARADSGFNRGGRCGDKPLRLSVDEDFEYGEHRQTKRFVATAEHADRGFFWSPRQL